MVVQGKELADRPHVVVSTTGRYVQQIFLLLLGVKMVLFRTKYQTEICRVKRFQLSERSGSCHRLRRMNNFKSKFQVQSYTLGLHTFE